MVKVTNARGYKWVFGTVGTPAVNPGVTPGNVPGGVDNAIYGDNDGLDGVSVTTYNLQCSCGKLFSGTSGYEELRDLYKVHVKETSEKWAEVNSIGGNPSESLSLEDLNALLNGYLCGSYKTWSVSCTSR